MKSNMSIVLPVGSPRRFLSSLKKSRKEYAARLSIIRDRPVRGNVSSTAKTRVFERASAATVAEAVLPSHARRDNGVCMEIKYLFRTSEAILKPRLPAPLRFQ